MNFHELNTHYEIAAAMSVLCESVGSPWLRYVINIVALLVTC